MNKPTRYYSKQQEKKVAKCVGGKRQPNSGATPFFRLTVLLIECKIQSYLNNWRCDCARCV